MSPPANAHKQPTGPSIAIIGTEGSGKTVLTTVLARRLRKLDQQGVFLDPQGVATMRYVERAWQTLQEGDWPRSTLPGELFELRWNLRIEGELEAQVRLIDAAGQDLRLLFGEEKVKEAQGLPEALRKLAEYCRSAEIVLFLVNLKDFEGQGDQQRRTDNEAAIKSAMDCLSSDGRLRRFCVVFTQVDLYQGTAQQHGGWLKVAEKAVPYISGGYLLSPRIPGARHVPVFAVSAVNKTKIAIDEQGIPRRVPDPPFESDGLDPVIKWLTAQVRDCQLPHEPPTQISEALSPVPPPRPTHPPWWKDWRYIAGAVGSMILLRSCSGGSRPTVPDPVVVEARSWDRPGAFDDWVTSLGTVRNDGASGNVVITSWVIENGREVDRKSQKMFLNAGQIGSFSIDLPGIHDLRNPHEVETSVELR